jgi:hypothetical protein
MNLSIIKSKELNVALCRGLHAIFRVGREHMALSLHCMKQYAGVPIYVYYEVHTG